MSTGTELATRSAVGAELAHPDHEGAVQVVRPTSMLPSMSDLQIIKGLSNMVAKAKGLAPSHIDTPEKAAYIMLYGLELGLRPMTSLKHINLVNGKVDLSGQAMMGIVLDRVRGSRFVKHVSDAKKADWSLIIPGRPELRLDYTIEEATASGQVSRSRGNAAKGVWDNYAADMLRWHVIKRLCRFGAPDAINAVENTDLSNVVTTAEFLDGMDTEFLPAASFSAAGEIPAAAYNPGDTPETPAPVEVPPRARFVDAATAAGHDVSTDKKAEQIARGLTGTLSDEPMTDAVWLAAVDKLDDRFASDGDGSLPLDAA